MSEFLKQALERLKKESAAVKGGKAAIMKGAVREALESFARQDEEFAQAIAQGGSFVDCMTALERATGNSISDLDAYRKAVQFYFPGAEIRMTMEIDVCPNRVQPAESEEPAAQKKQPKLLNLTDFL